MQGSDETFKCELSCPGTGTSCQRIIQRRGSGNLLNSVDEAAYDLVVGSAPSGYHAPAILIDDDTGSSEVGAYHRQPVGHGLQNRHAAGISQAGEQEEVCGAIVIANVVVRNPGDPFDNLGESQLAR